ncbi:MAG: prepilin peptidase [Chloroflexota bacterium]
MVTALLLAPGWVGAAIDLRTRRIPNWLTATAMLVAIAVAAASGDLLAAVAGGALAFTIGVMIASVARGAFGGGDVKLMAYAGAATGLGGVVPFLFWMSLAGGLLALGALAVHRRRGVTMPYGPAIAAGLTLTLLLA